MSLLIRKTVRNGKQIIKDIFYNYNVSSKIITKQELLKKTKEVRVIVSASR